uniref:Uncharacterized protein n=1 Tax=Romanomermis culicivorax TaxID=13658 RepID=A0A915HJ73_ROMCU
MVNEWQQDIAVISGQCGSSSLQSFNVAEALSKTPIKSKPFSVKVPVLSKQTQFTAPHVFIVLGDMQNMPFFLKRRSAFMTPMVMAAGKNGGTTMVTTSKLLINMYLTPWPRMPIKTMAYKKPANETKDKIPTNMNRSFVKAKSIGFGYIKNIFLNGERTFWRKGFSTIRKSTDVDTLSRKSTLYKKDYLGIIKSHPLQPSRHFGKLFLGQVVQESLLPPRHPPPQLQQDILQERYPQHGVPVVQSSHSSEKHMIYLLVSQLLQVLKTFFARNIEKLWMKSRSVFINCVSSLGNGTLVQGVLSPVNILSSTTHEPEIRTASHSMIHPSPGITANLNEISTIIVGYLNFGPMTTVKSIVVT